MPLFQYQSRAEPLKPLAAAAETITADKWQGERPDANPRVVRVATALLVAASFSPVAPPPPVTVDQWMPQAQPAVVRAPVPRPGGLFTVDALLVPVTPDAWQGSAVVPGRVSPRQPGAFATDPTGFAVPATAAAWQGSATVPTRPPAPRQTAGLAVIDPLLVMVPPNPDVWGAVWTQPQRVIPRQAGVFTVEPNPLRAVAVGDWQGFDDYRRPTPRPDLRQWWAGPTTLVASTEVITLDKWLWTWSQPDRHVAPRQTAGGRLPDRVAPTPDVSTWYALASQPARVAPRPPAGVSADVPAPVVGADWQGFQPQPQRRANRPAGGTVAPVYLAPAPVDNGPLDWLGVYPSAHRRRRQGGPVAVVASSGGVTPPLATAQTTAFQIQLADGRVLYLLLG